MKNPIWWCICIIYAGGTINAVNSRDFSIEPINAQVGLFIEEIANVKLYHDKWKIISTVNITEYNQEFEALKGMVLQILNVCDHVRYHIGGLLGAALRDPNTGCQTISNQLKLMILDLEENDTRWWLNTPTAKTKRSVAPFIGDIANILFGTLSEKHGELYMKEFERLEKQGLARDNIMGKQTTLLRSTIEAIQTDKKQNREQFENFNNQIAGIKDHLSHIETIAGNEKRLLQLKNSMQDLVSFTTLLLIGFKSKQKHFFGYNVNQP